MAATAGRRLATRLNRSYSANPRPDAQAPGLWVETMKTTTPPKHKTPNYKQVAHVIRDWDWLASRYRTLTIWTWQPQPLRSTRKDLP